MREADHAAEREQRIRREENETTPFENHPADS
jgi:hypothetical protein